MSKRSKKDNHKCEYYVSVSKKQLQNIKQPMNVFRELENNSAERISVEGKNFIFKASITKDKVNELSHKYPNVLAFYKHVSQEQHSINNKSTFTQALKNAGYGKSNFLSINNVKLKCRSWNNGHYVLCGSPYIQQFGTWYRGMPIETQKESRSLICYDCVFGEPFSANRFELSELEKRYPGDDWEVIK